MSMMMIPIKATTLKMSTNIHTPSPNLLPQPKKFQPYPSLFTPPRRTLVLSCSKEKEIITDEMLAVELGLEIKKLNSNIIQREEALEKSRELLFTEVCGFMGLKTEDLKKKWRKMDEDERWVLAKVFVDEWSDYFHPLSARCVKEMVDEYLGQDVGFLESGSGNLFPGLGKLLGFYGNSEE